MKKFVLLTALALLASFASAEARTNVRRYRIFGGVDTDSTQQLSSWFPVEGASRVYIRLYTTHVAFTALNADSSFSDSITTFKVGLSDSLANRVVSLSSFTSLTTGGAADSVLYDLAIANVAGSDTLIYGHPLPINKPLRAPANGSGTITAITPAGAFTGGAPVNDPEGIIPKRMMRVYVTPLRRATAPTQTATVPHRVNGLKGLYGEAIVVTRE